MTPLVRLLFHCFTGSQATGNYSAMPMHVRRKQDDYVAAMKIEEERMALAAHQVDMLREQCCPEDHTVTPFDVHFPPHPEQAPPNPLPPSPLTPGLPAGCQA